MSIESSPQLPMFGIADNAGTGAVVAEVDGTSCFLLFESLALAERYLSEAEAGSIFRFETVEELRGFTGGGTEVSEAMLNPTVRWTTGYMVNVAALLKSLERLESVAPRGQLTMHPKAIEALAGRLRAVAAAMLRPSSFAEDGESVFSGEAGNGAFRLPGQATDSLNALFAELLGKYKWESVVSSSFVEKDVRSILQDVTQTQDLDRVGPAFQVLVTKVGAQGQVGHLVVLPLAGVKLAGGSLHLGRVTLRTYSPDVYAEFEERCRGIILANTAHTLQERQVAFATVYQPQCHSLRERVCAEMVVHAEPTRAIEIATEETRAAIDLLRYAALFLDGAVTGGYQKPIGLFREIGEGYRPSMVVSENDTLVTANLALVSMPFEINEDTVALMNEAGVFELSGILTSENKTGFEEALLDALHGLHLPRSRFRRRMPC